ncbi:UDP-N-acetylmuramoylalanyl-D-glutamate--2, 6-diaminopimelate ligase [Candidatus Blochmanniella pennsylvanica str. BPEN]|uniref:UDP-N-acetylmuramoyl-L-alanyl-D-glutamate--2,6-diaminopimelate ligase n=1 Tax=Blochmanniella pennsylvanica (strain BPEN) TaxID=291272 RepID=Q493Q6_BLOPB|nr:UDP-N-acetylmuramoyl-L-alanyl-D-glutamate--2,6-diaminopimelate ligase [Candidatus Blochmannia pennsylvanicus]AAZ40781.1 UDP-N-acetylmuramoylalanyl-D-glutamate--2, 6-diaminopimelate ligase [Candidatus Blochmannia pennsylvanicus str. BPEN]UOY04559.1 UDP-N-acetylmuramoyl-L-alanyl-D-glutamate--2,6-diaminopimelate ligase [Candidatus Blochmannia pennsylvanicus]
MYDSRNLYKLFIPYVFNNPTSPALTGMELDSRNIVLGNLFVAVKGSKTDGRLYIDYAIKKGASAVLLESWSDITISKKYSYHLNKIPVVHVNYLPRYLSDIAGSFYNHPSRFLDLIGVTGTNGKTTITHLLARWVQLLGKKSAVMGTLGNGMLNNMCLSNNTTCSSIDAQKILSQFVKDKITFVAMEVSSHGLNQYRVDALYFKAAIFTNLSHDHLDYHGNVMQYSMSKWRLFDELCVEKYIINADDPVGCRWLYYLPQAIAVTITRNLPFFWKGKWICALKVNYHIHGTDITFDSSWGHGVIHSQLLGEFNVSNLLLALGTLLILGYPLSLLVHTSSQLQPVAGRMEVFRSHGYPTVIVDYAHTPDALEKVLISIRQFYYWGQLWCVFGCGGDRDPSKRALMGCIVSRYADYIIITNDNPRTEEPQSIINDITRGITHRKKIIKIIQNRCCAIQTAILKASLEDVILISGKGHEKYQIIGNNRIYHSDKDIVENFLKNDVIL